MIKTDSAFTAQQAARIQQFFDRLDQQSDALGLSVPQIIHLEALQALSPGTFGRAVADFLNQHGLSPLTTGPRRKQLHDAVHVLTGYGIDPVGEAEVQAFLLGSKFTPWNLLLWVGLLGMHLRTSPQEHLEQLKEIWFRFQQAYNRGRASSFDPDLWTPESLWGLSLEQVQQQLGV